MGGGRRCRTLGVCGLGLPILFFNFCSAPSLDTREIVEVDGRCTLVLSEADICSCCNALHWLTAS